MAQDITGNWTGHYEQVGARHGITMRVVQKGESFAGAMEDEDTLIVGSIPPEHLGDVELPDGVEPELFTSLPAASTVEGEVQGQLVTFAKSYRGSQSTIVRIGDREFTIEIQGHCVHYRGMLDRDGAGIRGEWAIAPPDPDGEPERGRFELRRD